MLRKAVALCNLAGEKIKDRLCSKGGASFSKESYSCKSEKICLYLGHNGRSLMTHI